MSQQSARRKLGTLSPTPPQKIPRTRTPDSALTFLRLGYLFGERTFNTLDTDVFRTRLLGLPATVVRGADWARLFYEGDRFSRDRAMPTSVKHLLQDDGSVQTLEGEDHLARKQLFVRLLTDENQLSRMRELFRTAWLESVNSWPDQVALADQLSPILTRTALDWMGFGSDWLSLANLSDDLESMVGHAGRFGPSNWAARLSRQRCEQTLGRLLEQARAGRLPLDPNSPLAEFLDHHDADGRPLDIPALTVEVLNVLRPIVAVGWFIVGAALLLNSPAGAQAHEAGQHIRQHPDEQNLEEFVQEVRRLYPFFPVIGGRARKQFEWRGNTVRSGDWVLLDMFATNRDPDIWPQPLTFRPCRFRGWDGDQNTLIPQGAGDVHSGHRCPGERATIELMKESLSLLIQDLDYDIPEQNTTLNLRQFPARPADGFLMKNVRRR